jgi:hypothetical protein
LVDDHFGLILEVEFLLEEFDFLHFLMADSFRCIGEKIYGFIDEFLGIIILL